MFEYNSSASNQASMLDTEPGWLSYLIKPIVMLVLIGGTCYISLNTVKKKKEEKSKGFSAPKGWGNDYKSAKGGSARPFGKPSAGGGGSRGRKR